MAADWSALTSYLHGKPDTVTVAWDELERIVGGMPRSALDHPAWWSGDRPHTRAWAAAGYAVQTRRPGVSVTFRRVGALRSQGFPTIAPPAESQEHAPVTSAAATEPRDRVLLVACGKSKAAAPTAAADLYTSARFRKARRFAEAAGHPWFILSAEHGLLAPDDWAAPYERCLPDTPSEYRRAWGEWVVARLVLLESSLRGVVMEIHAGSAYVQPLRDPLRRAGAALDLPLEGLTSGRWQGWYDARLADSPSGISAPVATGDATFVGDLADVIAHLANDGLAMSPAELDVADRAMLKSPGLYGWFVDAEGAETLSRGLAHDVEAGLVYVGQTGATRWPSGAASGSTLDKRLRSQHLRGRRSASTLRRTFGGVLDVAFAAPVARDALTTWMARHLRVVPFPVPDPRTLGDLERQVVQALDPPLNLDHVGATPLRIRLSALRSSSTTNV